MCGRYYVDDGTEAAVRRLTGQADLILKKGDIHPSEMATVLNGEGSAIQAQEMVWGFPKRDQKGLLINARAESIRERPTFRDSVQKRRCIIPAKGFYEWSPRKEKAAFEDGEKILFLAGCYDAEDRFVIITTRANASVAPVHDRMPLLLTEEEMAQWVGSDSAPTEILTKTPQLLTRAEPYQQMSLFD